MRTILLSTTIVLFSLPAVAGSIQGRWAKNLDDCDAGYPETQVMISGNEVLFVETTCTLDNPTGLRDMPQAKLYDLICNGEGETWSERAFIGTSGNDLLIYSRGYAHLYMKC